MLNALLPTLLPNQFMGIFFAHYGKWFWKSFLEVMIGKFIDISTFESWSSYMFFWGCFSHICERDHSHVSSCDYDLLSSMQIAFILPLLELSCCLVFSMTGLHSKLVVPFLIPWIFLAIHRLRLWKNRFFRSSSAFALYWNIY